ncbi:hypothetical protein [Pontibacter rugosus]|uniref:Uncharacterized protein n=1 Tax=Pontibacter rugosus TaxID=1745966 RepID=A0ABW3SK73_9BACT
MTKKYKTYTKLMLAGALAFSFAAEATNYTLAKSTEVTAKMAQEDVAMQWQKKLLGSYSDISTLTATNIRAAYITLLENVRAQHSNWNDADWNQAKAVLDKLDYKKNTVEDKLDLTSKAKIKALQGEFRTLETAGDVKD